MKIAVLDDYQDAVRTLRCFEVLAGHDVTVFTEPVGVRALAEFEALVLIRERTRLTRTDLEALPQLRVISQTGRVGDHLDVEACRELGIAVYETKGSPVATAELTWGLILAGARRIPQYAAALRAGAWQQNGLEQSLGFALNGRTLGVIGYGRIGQLVAGYGRAFGMNVAIWSGEGSRAEAQSAGFDVASSQRELFESANVVTVHVRLNDSTRGLVTFDDLASMYPDGLFVNTSRAALVETGALIRALEIGRPGVAAIDVFETEPTVHEPLLGRADVVATPHIGYVEQGSYELYFGAAFKNVVAAANQLSESQTSFQPSGGV